jgi:hypothetical protein
MRTRFDAPNILDWEKIKIKVSGLGFSDTIPPPPLLDTLQRKGTNTKMVGEEKISDT